MTPSERQKAFTAARNRIVRAQVGLMRGTRDDISRLLTETLEAIKTVLAGQPTDFERWSLTQLSAEIRQQLAVFGQQAGGAISTAAGKAWQLGEDLVDKPLDTAGVRISALLPRLDTGQLTGMRTFMVDRIRDVATEAANKITTELGLVVIGAKSPSEAIGAVTQILGESSRTRATGIIRTELGRAFSYATQKRMEDAAGRVPGLKKQWRRSGKLHPRLHHDLADGQVREIDQPFVLKPFGRAPVELMYPRDPKAPVGEVVNCGCVSLPFKDDWKVTHPGRAPGSALLDDAVYVGDALALRIR